MILLTNPSMRYLSLKEVGRVGSGILGEVSTRSNIEPRIHTFRVCYPVSSALVDRHAEPLNGLDTYIAHLSPNLVHLEMERLSLTGLLSGSKAVIFPNVLRLKLSQYWSTFQDLSVGFPNAVELDIVLNHPNWSCIHHRVITEAFPHLKTLKGRPEEVLAVLNLPSATRKCSGVPQITCYWSRLVSSEDKLPRRIGTSSPMTQRLTWMDPPLRGWEWWTDLSHAFPQLTALRIELSSSSEVDVDFMVSPIIDSPPSFAYSIIIEPHSRWDYASS